MLTIKKYVTFFVFLSFSFNFTAQSGRGEIEDASVNVLCVRGFKGSCTDFEKSLEGLSQSNVRFMTLGRNLIESLLDGATKLMDPITVAVNSRSLMRYSGYRDSDIKKTMTSEGYKSMQEKRLGNLKKKAQESVVRCLQGLKAKVQEKISHMGWSTESVVLAGHSLGSVVTLMALSDSKSFKGAILRAPQYHLLFGKPVDTKGTPVLEIRGKADGVVVDGYATVTRNTVMKIPLKEELLTSYMGKKIHHENMDSDSNAALKKWWETHCM